MLNSRKNKKIMSILNFKTPLRQNLDPQSKKISTHCVKLFLGKFPKYNNLAPKCRALKGVRVHAFVTSM